MTRNLLRFMTIGGALCLLAACAQHNRSLTISSGNPAETKQTLFASPEDAVENLVEATREERKDKLFDILGSDADKLISSGDAVADHQGREKFVAAYDKEHDIEESAGDKAVLVIGEEEWPLPIPLVHAAGGWRFDTKAGEEEILNRRIGRNELNVLGVCRAYVEAQREFASLSPHGQEYAKRFRSHKGHHDGLYWPAENGEPESPFGPLMADATAEGYSRLAIGKLAPYHGYYYKILKRQTSHASGGAKDYILNGHMTGGFALLAFPARYGDSGVMSFMVNQDGIIYERNLGPHTPEIAHRITEFDPDSGWNIVQ